MQNGYALCTRHGLDSIAEYLVTLPPEQVDALRGKLRIGLHRHVEVTDSAGEPRPIVSQAFCSALPVTYAPVLRSHWAPFASLILQAAYESTIAAAVVSAQRGVSNRVLLTQLGGGAFGNDDDCIDEAILRALEMARGVDLDVRLVSYSTPAPRLLKIAEHFS